MNIIAWIILGALAGWAASKIMGTNEQQGFLGDVITGIAGAFIGGIVFNFFGAVGVTGFNLGSFLVALVGAIILIFIRKTLANRR